LPTCGSSYPVGMDHSILSLAAKTGERPPEVSSTTFSTRPPELQPVHLKDTDFPNPCSLVRHGMSRIWFLSVGHAFAPRSLQIPPPDDAPGASL